MMKKLNGKNPEYTKVAKDFAVAYDPPISKQWEHVTKASRLMEKQKQMKRQAERKKKGGKSNEEREASLQKNATSKTSLNMSRKQTLEDKIDHTIQQSKKALECLLPEARKKNEEKEILALLVDTKINKDVKKVAEDERKMFHNAAKLFELMKDKLDTY